VAAPVCEELFFRGILLQGLLRNYRPAVAITQSALLFGLVHFNPTQSIVVFFMGLLVGWVYYYTHSLMLCIYLHALNNLLAFSSMQSASRQSEQDMLRHLGIAGYVAALVVAAAVLAGGIWWLRRATPLRSARPTG
jgi:membrane protease YdiL (CAAX protease family)